MIVLKCYLSLPLVAGALLVGLPYSISLVAQWLYGWPSKPGYQKYLEAVKPRRIYCLTRAVLEMLKYLQYGKLYFQWKLWYSNDKNNKHYVKGLTFGRRGNKLDLYYSPSRGHSDAAPVPVVVFVYGGAWGSGDRSIYCLLALQMAKELNASVICPDYSIYPKGNVLNMIQDISDSLLWVREKGNVFNLDQQISIIQIISKGSCDTEDWSNDAENSALSSQDNIILIGHSAGAHLCAITTLFLVNNVEELFIETNKQRDLVSAIKGIIGLSGVYSIMDHYKHEKMRAVEYVSTMHKAMDGVENFDYYSPTSLLKKLNKDQLKRVPPVGLLHGTNDIIVPVESSVMFSELLSSLSVSMSLYLIPKMNHTEMVTDLMAPDRHFYHTVYGCIKQEYSKFQG